MTPERWARITGLFDQASEQPTGARAAWLAAHCDDEAVRADVVAMLQTFDDDPGFLEQPTDIAGAVALAATSDLTGRRVGAYRIVAEIGRGGMGLVYEAHRDDQEFDRRAAIKILPVWSGAGLADRFRFERHVLAGLDHPGIARLIDAGTTGEGVPYLIMEFVDGRPIDAWCRAHAPRLTDRVALVERVCEALAHAHRNLVIHRDVKPGNILVTADGQPKLLDFGIAAMLTAEGEARGTTRTGHHSFTPEYASPEQVRGERVTTASDVYSVGVILYLLLSGRPPYHLQGLSPLDAMRTVCEVEPPLMSSGAEPAARTTLRGDLDAIVAKSLAKAPAERYGTIVELAADLKAWRERRPVSALPQSFAYRARRFVRRNRGAVAAAAIIIVAILGGAATTAWQARVAAQERDKAQNRFRQVQEFSRSLLFEIHDALRPLPGATAPRRLLLDRAVQFLDGLAADAGDDDALTFELAQGYRRLGSVQGLGSTDNLGEASAAAVSLAKGAALADRALAARPDSIDRLILASDLHGEVATIERGQGRLDAADRAAARHMSLLSEIERRHPGDPAAVAAVAAGYSNAGMDRVAHKDMEGARRYHTDAVRLYESLPASFRSTDAELRAYSVALKRLGAVEMVTGVLDESEGHYRAALAIEDDLIRRDPGNTRWPFEQSYTLSDLALALTRRGRYDEAIVLFRRALEPRQNALAADPRNVRALSGVASLQLRLGNACDDASRFAEALEHRREGLRLREMLVAVQQGQPMPVFDRGWAVALLANTLLRLADGGGAAAAGHVQEARTLFQRIRLDEMKRPGQSAVDGEFQRFYDALSQRLAKR